MKKLLKVLLLLGLIVVLVVITFGDFWIFKDHPLLPYTMQKEKPFFDGITYPTLKEWAKIKEYGYLNDLQLDWTEEYALKGMPSYQTGFAWFHDNVIVECVGKNPDEVRCLVYRMNHGFAYYVSVDRSGPGTYYVTRQTKLYDVERAHYPNENPDVFELWGTCLEKTPCRVVVSSDAPIEQAIAYVEYFGSEITIPENIVPPTPSDNIEYADVVILGKRLSIIPEITKAYENTNEVVALAYDGFRFSLPYSEHNNFDRVEEDSAELYTLLIFDQHNLGTDYNYRYCLVDADFDWEKRALFMIPENVTGEFYDFCGIVFIAQGEQYYYQPDYISALNTLIYDNYYETITEDGDVVTSIYENDRRIYLIPEVIQKPDDSAIEMTNIFFGDSYNTAYAACNKLLHDWSYTQDLTPDAFENKCGPVTRWIHKYGLLEIFFTARNGENVGFVYAPTKLVPETQTYMPYEIFKEQVTYEGYMFEWNIEDEWLIYKPLKVTKIETGAEFTMHVQYPISFWFDRDQAFEYGDEVPNPDLVILP